MTRNEIDAIVDELLLEVKKRGELFERRELKERLEKDYSKDQTERIICRFFYRTLCSDSSVL